MAPQLCDICKTRPATAEVAVSRNGQHKMLRGCAADLLVTGQNQT